MSRAPSLAFGLLMVAAGGVHADGPALMAVAVALGAVAAGTVFRPAATLAVVAVAVALALSGPATVLAAVAGLAATAYLVTGHAKAGAGATSLTAPTLLGALGMSAVAVLGTAIAPALPWVPLAAPLAVVVVYLMVVSRYAN